MKKLRILLAFLMLFAIGFTGANLKVHADTASKLVVHYHRFDPNYGPWKLWLWQYEPNAGDGGDYSFTGDDAFGKVMEMDLAGTSLEGASKVGFLIKDANWNKDIGQDRFIDMTNPNASGEVHVYLVSGDATVYYDDAGIDISNRALQVDFVTINTIDFTASTNVVADDVTVKADDVIVPIDSFSMINGEGTITLSANADLGKTYKLYIDFNEVDTEAKEYVIGFAGLYASDEFNDEYAYDGVLGTIYSTAETTFKLWAPLSSEIVLNLYTYGHKSNETDYDGNAGTDTPYETINLTKGDKGVWSTTVTGDLHGVYYTYSVTNGSATNETSDPYAYSSGVNGVRSMVVNFDSLDPENWVDGYRPETIQSYNDSVITEIHVRDYTTHSSWNGTEDYRGKFLGLVERGTEYKGVTTGFDHLVELGVTHVQILPAFDFGAAVDETRLLDPNYIGKKDTVFNWGYMPENFNVVEGSYSTNPYDGSVRVTEYKEMVQAFHDSDIRVVMDVVYNHTGKSADSNFDLIVPGYYFRLNDAGGFSNGSGTGNETASEHYMMRKFMVDSVTFWAEEYNISGFRFDLMKLHDYTTMNAIVDSLHAIDPTILVYGEPWTGGTSPLSDDDAAFNSNLDKMPGVAVFNDDTRDGIKGSVFDATNKGFIQGDTTSDERIKLGVLGGVSHPNLSLPALPKGAWAINPNQTVNYATAHDNNVLYDKLMMSTSGVDFEQIKDMQKQAGAILLTSNGIPFLHGGIEFMRSKPCTVIDNEAQGECDASNNYDHNSYRSPDQTNQIDWQWKVDNMDVFNYYKGLINLRTSVNTFSYDSQAELAQKMIFMADQSGIVSYFIYDEESPWQFTLVSYNNGSSSRTLDLQGYTWNLVVNKDTAGTDTIEEVSGSYSMEPNETVVMYVSNPNVVFVPDVIKDATSTIEDTQYNNKSPLDIDTLITAIKAELHSDATVEVIGEVDYENAGEYPLVIKVTDQFGNLTSQSIMVSVTEPTGGNIGIIIGSILAGLAVIATGVFFIVKKPA